MSTVVLVNNLAQVHFRVPLQAAEAVVNLLHELSGGGVEERDGETLDQAGPGLVEFVAWLSPNDVEGHVKAVKHLLASLSTMGVQADPFTWSQKDADPEAWVDAYKRHFKTTRLARRFVVKPSWETYSPEAGDILLELDPGMAFGTGLHASTKLVLSCLDRIARLCPTPNTVLDLGCGTGILAIAAAKLWNTSKIVAIDNDPTAVEVCLENIARNGLSDRIEVRQGTLGQGTLGQGTLGQGTLGQGTLGQGTLGQGTLGQGTLGQGTAGAVDERYSLVLANLSYEVLSASADSLLKTLDDFGRIVLSGLLAEQAQALCLDLTKHLTLEPEYSEEETGWRALLLRVRA